ncbi:MAG: hypothetical protein QN174_13875 [Armatimonadota bacterium]|nr:hypothetical protein [Armatimonadota bacterium]MDR7421778.1 hypothetical protein [Armatimonadota bacterium]MDR7454112.1 hypothetical protein [Armatimonadota bacterium]MDR7498031.1 hypothetical protein [Armatimonadota bacterium]
MISLFAWPDGLAVVVEGAYRRRAALFGPDGWRFGDPADVLAAGPPPDAEHVSFALPAWLVDQLPTLDLMFGGLHTDFVRLDRLLGRLQAQAADGTVLVLGPSPAVVVLQGGALRAVEPSLPDGAPVLPAVARARGWILVYAGKVGMPVVKPFARSLDLDEIAASPAAPPPRAASPPPAAVSSAPAAAAAAAPPVPAAQPAPATPAASVIPSPSAVPAAPGPPAAGAPASEPGRDVPGERFVASPAARDVPEELAARLRAEAGEEALVVLALLDGSRTTTDVAGAAGLPADRVAAVIRVLVAHRLAFRYVSRARPAPARGPR